MLSCSVQGPGSKLAAGELTDGHEYGGVLVFPRGHWFHQVEVGGRGGGVERGLGLQLLSQILILSTVARMRRDPVASAT